MKILGLIIVCFMFACFGALIMACLKSGGYADKMKEAFDYGFRKGKEDGKE